MKLVDLDQTIFVPVVDETKGGMTVEMQMTVGEFFGRFCEGFEPEGEYDGAVPYGGKRMKCELYHDSFQKWE